MENEVNYADLPDELFEQIETFIKTEIPAPGDILQYWFILFFVTILIAERDFAYCFTNAMQDHLDIKRNFIFRCRRRI